MISVLFTFFRGVLSEPDGTPSFSRVGSCASLVCVLYWITFIVHRTTALPDITHVLGMILLVATLYAINRAPELLSQLVSGIVALRTGQVPPKQS